MSDPEYNFDTGSVNKHVNNFISSLGDLRGKKILDCPAGDGRTSYQFARAGADVTSADLFPQFFKIKNSKCDRVDLTQGLPYADATFDIAICQEGIEHMPNQLFVLQEFSRVLKRGGILVITAPNISQLRSKLSYFFCETDYYKRSPANELDSVWFSEEKSHQFYFGHVFMIHAQKLRVLSIFSGFQINQIRRTDLSSTSVFLLPFLYPFILLFNLAPFIFYKKKLKHVDPKIRQRVMRDQFVINCSPSVLTSKHLMLVLEKKMDQMQVAHYLKSLSL